MKTREIRRHARPTVETRARTGSVELRAVTEAEKAAGYIGVLHGEIPFNTDSHLLAKRGRARPFVEQVAPEAFKRSLAEDKDIMAFAGHTDDPLAAFARVGENLELTATATALQYRALIPDTQAGRDLLQLAEKRIIRGTSFEFEVRGAEGERYEKRDAASDLRVITDARLLAVNPVANPAYPDAEISVDTRSQAGAPAEARAYLHNPYAEGYSPHGDPLAGTELLFCTQAVGIELGRLQDAQAYLRAQPAGQHVAYATAVIAAAGAALADLIAWLTANGATPDAAELAERARAAVGEARAAAAGASTSFDCDRDRRVRILHLGSR